jgi:hypothetical protein
MSCLSCFADRASSGKRKARHGEWRAFPGEGKFTRAPVIGDALPDLWGGVDQKGFAVEKTDLFKLQSGNRKSGNSSNMKLFFVPSERVRVEVNIWAIEAKI